MSLILAMLLLGGSSVSIWAGITDPEGGVWQGLGNIIDGTPNVKHTSATAAAFLASVGATASSSSSSGGGGGGAGGSAGGSAQAGPNVATAYTAPKAAGGGGGGVAAQAVAFARAQVGKPYQWGATGPRAFDCSGLIYAAYKHAGKTIPRTTATQLTGLPRVSRADLRPGDLVFPHPGHVFMYAGGGQVIEAPHTGTNVHVTNLYAFWTARRVPGA